MQNSTKRNYCEKEKKNMNSAGADDTVASRRIGTDHKATCSSLVHSRSGRLEPPRSPILFISVISSRFCLNVIYVYNIFILFRRCCCRPCWPLTRHALLLASYCSIFLSCLHALRFHCFRFLVSCECCMIADARAHTSPGTR